MTGWIHADKSLLMEFSLKSFEYEVDYYAAVIIVLGSRGYCKGFCYISWLPLLPLPACLGHGGFLVALTHHRRAASPSALTGTVLCVCVGDGLPPARRYSNFTFAEASCDAFILQFTLSLLHVRPFNCFLKFLWQNLSLQNVCIMFNCLSSFTGYKLQEGRCLCFIHRCIWST